MHHLALDAIAERLSEQVASSYLASHPEVLLLSIEEAARVGKSVAASRFVRKNDLA
ncbi:MAG TPA: hypothetical protein VNE38_12965 [Ktedonobacteraceae bacterium]|nr:hypothetical protein [Ktedonobacteraceae bacterium]